MYLSKFLDFFGWPQRPQNDPKIVKTAKFSNFVQFCNFCQIIDKFPGFECWKQSKEKKIVIQEAFSKK